MVMSVSPKDTGIIDSENKKGQRKMGEWFCRMLFQGSRDGYAKANDIKI